MNMGSVAVVSQQEEEFLRERREGRLDAYRSYPKDIEEHCSNETQNEVDYHKRFAFELLQNADDAMHGEARPKTVRFEIRDDVLIVANTGRPIDEDDVEALCSIGITTKKAEEDQLASIGHKGRGFSSVLELTEQPQVYSTGISFLFDRERSREAIREVVEEHDEWSMDDIDGIPLMRLPFPPQKTPERVEELLDQGYHTVFRFPLKDEQIKEDVIETVTGLDRNTVLFLQELERLEIHVEGHGEERWVVERDQQELERDETELTFTSVRHQVDDRTEQEETFALFSRNRVEIGQHTGGIKKQTWGEVNYTQIGVALRVDERDDGIHLTKLAETPSIHVFLPTKERCPIPILVNGAFHTKISRTDIDVTPDEDNYNRFLLQEAANLLATDVRQYVAGTATTVEEFIECLDFTQFADDAIEPDALSRQFIDAVCEEFADIEFIPQVETTATGETVTGPDMTSISNIVVPYYAEEQPEIAKTVATIYGNGKLNVKGVEVSGWFPKNTLLTPRHADILKALGADVLAPENVPLVLGNIPDDEAPLHRYPEPADGPAVDPILQVLIRVWKTITGQDETVDRFKTACQEAAVFPVGTPDGQVVRHVSKADKEFFLPPEQELPDIELSRVEFLTSVVYPHDETSEDLKSALKGIWGVKDFEFDRVVQNAILPDLPRSRNPDADDSELRNVQVLDMIRRLARETVEKSDEPLPLSERNETQFRLCLLPVPTRSGEWRPAYTVYFGEEWQSDAPREKRIEAVLEAADVSEASYLASPEDLPEPVASDEEVFEEWKQFFRWLGVTPHIRLKPLFDPKKRRNFKDTKDINRPETGSVLSSLKKEYWEKYQHHLQQALEESEEQGNEKDSVYQLQGMEFFNTFVESANDDQQVAELLFNHIAAWWDETLREYKTPVLATSDHHPGSGRKNSPVHDHEKRNVGLNLWLWQLKHERWCPSNHGRVKPNEVWSLTENKFEIGGAVLLPVLTEQAEDAADEAEDLLRLLGIRQNLSRDTFRPADAERIMRLVADMFDDKSDEQIFDSLRQIKPVYRKLSELLPPLDQSGSIVEEEWVKDQTNLKDIDVLSRKPGEGGFVFEPAGETYFVRSPDILARIPVEGIPVFVLQEKDAVRLGTYADMHDLKEDAEPDPVLSGEQITRTEEVKECLSDVAPFILCRLEAERSSQDLIDRDRNRMNTFLEHLSVMDEIKVAYEFETGEDGTRIPEQEQDFFLDRRDRGQKELPLPFVKNKSEKDEEQKRALARALCEYLEVSQFEGIVTLLNAETDDQRLELLRHAGAPATPDDVKSKRQALFDDGPSDEAVEEFEIGQDTELEGLQEETSATTESDEQELRPRREQKTVNHPVYDEDELKIQGSGITLITASEDSDSTGDSGNGSGGTGSGDNAAVSQDYRNKVDELGMSITLQYERDRLQEEGCETPENYVFDVHREDLIEDARNDPVAGSVLERLEEEVGLPMPFPGFDILTVDPETGEEDRLIELKSSGVNRKKPTVTWNEWKTASTSAVRKSYYLYIVGNLRKDITSEPYLREIEDPFGRLNTETKETVKKEIQINVTSFKEGEYIKETNITVEDDSSD